VSAVAGILVVDDNAVMLDAISQMLRHEGYEFFPGAGPRQALEISKIAPLFILS
jgi:CheY-like chemotaxis protein